MKPLRKIFFLTMVACMVFLQVAPAMPVYAAKQVQPQRGVAALERPEIVPAPINTDWSQVDWDSEVVLLPNQKAYQQTVSKALLSGDSETAKDAALVKTKLSSEEALEYFNVPKEIAEVVREYRDGAGMFSVKDDNSAATLREYIQTLMPDTVKTESVSNEEDLQKIDLKTAPKLQIKKARTDQVKATQLDIEIKNRVIKFDKHPVLKASPREFGQQVKPDVWPKKKTSVITDKIHTIFAYLASLLKVETAQATESVDLINYYSGIENNALDNALYYIANTQVEDGSFSQVSKYEETAETVLMLSTIGRTGGVQFSQALAYLVNTEPVNIREKAIKVRILSSLGQSGESYLNDIVQNENSDQGYGIDVGYESDIVTTLEVALAMYTTNYSLQDKFPRALKYILNQIPANGELKYSSEGPVSYYLINKTLEYLWPFRTMSLNNDAGVSIVVQDKVNNLIGYLSSQFDDENERLLGTNDAIDEIMTLRSWKTYNVESARQKILQNKLIYSQYINGSFEDSLLATVYALDAMKTADVLVNSVESTGSLESRVAATFDVVITNQGYAPATEAVLRVFADNVNTGLSFNLAAAGLVLAPNESITIGITIPTSETKSYTGTMDLKFYLESKEDVNFDNNWLYKTFVFAPASNGTPALPLYYIATKHEINGVANINVRWPKKTDALRYNYVIMFREKGQTEWSYYGINNTWNGAFLGGVFDNDKTYQVSAGVLHQDQGTITYFNDYTEIKVSGDTSAYYGGVSGQVTLDKAPLGASVSMSGYGVSGYTSSSGVFEKGSIPNGSTAAWVATSQYEPIVTKFPVGINATTTNVRFFTHLKSDSVAPAITKVELRGSSSNKVLTKKEYTLYNWGSDANGLKEGDFYLWNPVEQHWMFLATSPAANSQYATYSWYVPSDLPLATGYKIKGILRDHRNNESTALEWGPFEIIDGTSPSVTVTSPNGDEVYALGTTTTISWQASSTYGIKSVRVYSEYLGLQETIYSGVNTNSVVWSIPNSAMYASTKAKILVSATDNINNLSSSDYSDNYFSIVDNSTGPKLPWNNPVILSKIEDHATGCDISQPLSQYDSAGRLHVVYFCIKDVYGTPRIITQRGYEVVKDGDIVSEPTLIFEKQWTIENDDFSNYRPLDGKLIITPDDKMHLLWQGGGNSGCLSFNSRELYHIYYDGTNWSSVTNVSNENTNMRELQVVADSLGNIHAVWQDGITYDDSCSVTGTYKLKYAKYNPALGWSQTQVSDMSESISSARLAVMSDGNLTLLYSLYTNGKMNIRQINKLANGWSSPENVYLSPESGGMSEHAISAGQNNKLYYIFQQYVASPVSAYKIMFSEYNGTQWLPAIELIAAESGVSYEDPHLYVENDGKIHLVYRKIANNVIKIMWKVRTVHGTWMNGEQVSQDAQRPNSYDIDISSDGTSLNAVWLAQYSRKFHVHLSQALLKTDYISPDAVSGLAAQSATNSVQLAWNKYADIDKDFDRFEIYMGKTADGVDGYNLLHTITASTTVGYIDGTEPDYVGDRYYIIKVYDTAGHVAVTDIVGPVQINLVLPPAPPIAKFEFNEQATGTTVFDGEGSQKVQATCQGAGCPESSVPGVMESGVRFNGSSQYLSVSNVVMSNTSTAFALTAWVRPVARNDNDKASMFIAGIPGVYELKITNPKYGVLQAAIYSVDGVKHTLNSNGNYAAMLDVWNQVGMSYDGQTLKLLSNGQEVGSMALAIERATSVGQMYIGGQGASEYFKGSMDLLYLYDRALDFSDYVQSYSNLINQYSDRLVLDFNELTGSNLFQDTSLWAHKTYCVDVSKCPATGLASLTGKALEFNGMDQYLSVKNKNTLSFNNAFSISTWIRPELRNDDDKLSMLVVGKYGTWDLRIGNPKYGKLYVTVLDMYDQKTTVWSTDYAVRPGQWNYVTMSYDGTVLKVYSNGREVASKALTGQIKNVAGDLNIGGNTSGSFFKGKIDSLKARDRAESLIEHQAEYDTVIGAQSDRLSLDFDETEQVTKFVDNSAWEQSVLCGTGTCPQAGVEGIVGRAVQFDGVSSSLYIKQSNAHSLINTVSLSAWIRPAIFDANDKRRVFIAGKPGSYELWIANARSGVLSAVLIDANGQKQTLSSTSGAVKIDEWNYVSFSYDGTTMRLLVNGKEIASKSFSGKMKDISGTFYIGSYGSASVFLGKIDSITLSSDAVDINSHKSVYDGVKNSITEPLVLLFNDPVSSTQFIDQSVWRQNVLCATGYCPLANVPGVNDTAVEFDGVSSYLRMKSTNSMVFKDVVSISAWIKPSARYENDNRSMQIAGKDGSYNFRFANPKYGILSAALNMADGQQKTFFTPAGAVKKDQWNYVTFSYDGTSVKIFANGKQVFDQSLSGELSDKNADFYIGGIPTGIFFKGSIDDLVVSSQPMDLITHQQKWQAIGQ